MPWTYVFGVLAVNVVWTTMRSFIHSFKLFVSRRFLERLEKLEESQNWVDWEWAVVCLSWVQLARIKLVVINLLRTCCVFKTRSSCLALELWEIGGWNKNNMGYDGLYCLICAIKFDWNNIEKKEVSLFSSRKSQGDCNEEGIATLCGLPDPALLGGRDNEERETIEHQMSDSVILYRTGLATHRWDQMLSHW